MLPSLNGFKTVDTEKTIPVTHRPNANTKCDDGCTTETTDF